MAGARRSHDIVVLGDGYLARLTACLAAKAGKRVVRLRRSPEIEVALPPFPPLDLTLVPSVRETALKLGILVPLRDRLRSQFSLGHFVSASGSAELFLERAARDHQQRRLDHPCFDGWCQILSAPQPDPVALNYPDILHHGWWRRLRNRRGWSELELGGDAGHADALNNPFFIHPWSRVSTESAHLRWNGQRDLHVLDRPLRTFLELAEARAGVELIGRDHAVDYELHRGRLISVITDSGLRIGAAVTLWSDSVDAIDLPLQRAVAKLKARWAADGSVAHRVRRLRGSLAAVDWPPFLSGPILVADGAVQIRIEARGHEVHLETWLHQEQASEPIEAFFAQHFPLLRDKPLRQVNEVTFERRADPGKLPPRLMSEIGGLAVIPDRLIHGLGIDAPFALAGQLAQRLCE